MGCRDHKVTLKGQIWRAMFGRLDNQYLRELNATVLPGCDSLLDVGCGFNSPVRHLKARPPRLVGVDAFEPALEESRKQGIHDDYALCGVLGILDRFGPGSFDVVLASDLIEHLDPADGYELIRQMEAVARRQVLIYTPNGFLPQGEEYGNPWQIHRSGWTAGQMKTMGYDVTGIEGFRWLRGEMARIRFKPYMFWLTVSLVSQIPSRVIPAIAFRILCSKRFPAGAPRQAGVGTSTAPRTRPVESRGGP